MAHNRLRSVPDSVFDLTSLEKLDVSDNTLTELSSRVGKLVKLSALHMARNKLEELPHELVKLQALQWLDVRSNSIRLMPTDALQKMPSLTLLWADGNPCCTAEGGVRADLAKESLLGAGCAKIGCVQRSGSSTSSLGLKSL